MFDQNRKLGDRGLSEYLGRHIPREAPVSTTTISLDSLILTVVWVDKVDRSGRIGKVMLVLEGYVILVSFFPTIAPEVMSLLRYRNIRRIKNSDIHWDRRWACSCQVEIQRFQFLQSSFD